MPEIHKSTNIQNAGGKAKGLLFLEQKNFLVPEFYILDFNTVAAIKNGGCNIPELLESWIEKNQINQNSLWAVRSSADHEDGKEKSFAGFYKTMLNVQVTNMEEAILSVCNFSSSLMEHHQLQQASFAIIIQEMIQAEYSGVLFSHNPNNIHDETTYLSFIPGIGENLVSEKEKSFDLSWHKGHVQYHDEEKEYRGQVYQNGLSTIAVPAAKIKADTARYIPALINGSKKLYKLLDYPVDIEFAIANGKIYWLQVRPITTGKEEPVIWDNSAAEANYPGIILPLSLSLISNSFYEGYKNLGNFLGMPAKLLQQNDELLQHLTGQISGAFYYNVSAWQKLIYQLPFGKKIAKALLTIWGIEKAAFVPVKYGMNLFQKAKLFLKLVFSLFFLRYYKKKFYRQYQDSELNFLNIPIKEKTHAELIEIYKAYEKKITSMWQAPLMNNLLTVTGMTITKKVLERSRLNKEHPNFLNDSLYSFGEVVSVKILKNLLKIFQQIKDDKLSLELFKEQEPQQIYLQLSQLNPTLYNRIVEHVQQYGERSDEPELKMETINFKESPVLFFAYLKNNLDINTSNKEQENEFNYEEIIKKTYPNRFFKRWFLSGMVRFTINRIADRENFRFKRTKAFAFVRQLFREMDAKLLTENKIESNNDSLYLQLNEITDLTFINKYKEMIARRKLLYDDYKSSKIPVRYIQQGDRYQAVDTITATDEKVNFKGTGCCSGVVEAEVKIIYDFTKDISDCTGKILVANFFEPGKLALFSKAAAIISVRGNLLSHTAILCREMGIPSIVGAKRLLSKIKNGDIIQMDGATGKIKIISAYE